MTPISALRYRSTATKAGRIGFADRVTQAAPRAARASRPSVSTALRAALRDGPGLAFIALFAVWMLLS